MSNVGPADTCDRSPGARIRAWCQERSFADDNYFVRNLRQFLPDEQIILVLDLLDLTCSCCFDSDRACQCWNDD